MSADLAAEATTWWQRTRTFGQRLAATLRFWAAPSSRPLPHVEVHIGPWVPIWLVTAVMGALALGGAALVAGGPIGWLAMGGIVCVLVLLPEGPATGIYAAAVGVLLLTSGAEPFAGRVFALVALVHLVAVLDSVSAGLPWRTRLQLSALRAPLRRYAFIQVGAQGLAVLGAVLTGQGFTLLWLPVVAAIGLVVVAVALDAWLEAGEKPEHRVR